jgi:phosphoribosyl-ATP pyrophosphohydrolase
MTAPATDDTLLRLAAVVAARRGGDPERSYVARLLGKGADAVLKKVGEEATEVVMAGKDGDPGRIVAEMADLWFHCLVALEHYGLGPQAVLDELRRREGMSGLEEFALRKAREREQGTDG